MTSEEFDALVSRLEERARRSPAGYRARVMLLAFLGNAYLAFILFIIVELFLLSLASIVFLKAVGLKIAAVVGFFLWMIIKALRVKLLPPEGEEVRREQAPALFAMIDELRRQLGAPAFHHVLVTDEFNAGVVQAPRLGIFGWPRNYLLLGLPLMKSLGVEQFKAVLAHEFGHLAKSHGRLSNWIYRQRLRWSRLMDTLETNQSKGSFLFKPFLNWYSPYFNAYSFPLARANEYEADAASVRLTSKQAAAEALTSVNVVGSYLGERYWPEIHKQADELPQPGYAPYSGMGHRVATELDEPSARAWMEQALARKTTSADTHPALADRLEAIGEAPRLAPPQPGQGADRLLGRALEPLTELFDRRWKERILPSWEQRHREVQDSRRRLAELDALHASGRELSTDEAYDRARLNDFVGNAPEIAIAQFRTLLQREPDGAATHFMLGARLLGRDDPEGCALVERATELDENLIVRGAELLRDYYWRNGRNDEADAWHRRLVERVELEQAAYKERNQLLFNEKFDVSGLPEEVLEKLRVQLRAVPGLRKAYFVRKRTRHLTHLPCYVLGFKVSRWFQVHSKKKAAAMLEKIRGTVDFPGETIIINVEGENYQFGRKFRWMRGSRIV